MTVSVLWKTDINLIDPPHTHTHLLTFHEETVQFRDSTETQTLLHFLTHRGMTACMYVLAWLSIIVTYLIKIGKTVGILTQTLVLSPESVTSSYFPKLLQIHDIQCTEQRRDTCYRQTPDLCQPQTKLNNGRGHEPDAAKCHWEGEGVMAAEGLHTSERIASCRPGSAATAHRGQLFICCLTWKFIPEARFLANAED